MNKPQFNVTINLTNRCNLNCDYCIASVPYVPVHDDISLSALKGVAKLIKLYLSDFNVRVLFVGGEPIIYPYLDETIREFQNIDNIKQITLCTNGSLPIETLISSQDKMTYSITHHTDVIIEKRLYEYHKNFMQNLEFFIKKSLIFNVKIVKRNNSYNILKEQYINEISPLCKYSLLFVKLIPTPYYNFDKIDNNYSLSLTKNTPSISNIHYNKLVYPFRAINVTRDIAEYSHRVKYIFSYICEINDASKYIPLFSVKHWDKLKANADKTILCQKQICYCDICEEADAQPTIPCKKNKQ